MSRSMAARNAASVFPDPVGASTSADSPAAIAGQASSCARVGDANVASNQARVAGWKVASGSVPTRKRLGRALGQGALVAGRGSPSRMVPPGAQTASGATARTGDGVGPGEPVAATTQTLTQSPGRTEIWPGIPRRAGADGATGTAVGVAAGTRACGGV